jgi:hypothetical protein
MRRLWKGCRASGIAAGVFAVALGVSTVRAQTLFAWPKDTVVDLASYQTVEECRAAVLRVYDEEFIRNPDSDTLPQTLARVVEEARKPLSERLRRTASACSARYAAATAPLTDFASYLALFLASGRDADATRLVARRLKAVAPAALTERGAVLDTVIHEYLNVRGLAVPEATLILPNPLLTQPARLAAAEPLVTELGRMTAVSWVIRGDCYAALANAAWQAGDTLRAAEATKALTALAGTLTDAERRSNEFVNVLGPALDDIQTRVYQAVFLNSLQHSTEAYAALYEQFWKNVNHGAIPYGFTKPIGKVAPPIAADFWLNRSDSTGSRPTKGKVSLILFINEQSLLSTSARPISSWPRLRRLAQRFPALEITFVAQTYGYFSAAVPPAPVEEAGMLAHALFAERHLSGALAVTNTASWRLPNPDQRRVNPLMPNLINYSFGRTWQPPLSDGGAMNIFLVDQNGIVVDATAGNVEEATLPDLIDVLMHRTAATRP